MKVKVWGARGSICTSGKEFSVYGGNTTCIEVRSRDNDVFVIDGGTGIRPLGKALHAESIAKIHWLFTHVHWDHVMGVPFFLPLYQPEVDVCIYGPDRQVLEGVPASMRAPYFPVEFSDLQANIAFQEIPQEGQFEVGNMRIKTVPLSHPNGGVAYRFEEDCKVFSFVTDNELEVQHEGGRSFDDYVDFVKNSNLLLHDAQFEEAHYEPFRGWGHSTVEQTLELARQAEVENLGFFHYSPDSTDEMLDALYEHCAQKPLPFELLKVYDGFEYQL